MNKRFLWPVLWGIVASFIGAASAQTIDKNTPDGLIKSITRAVMKEINSDPSIRQGDIGKIAVLVDKKILPHANVQRTTQLAMGHHWNKATPQQRQQLIVQFKDLLFYTYAGALAHVRNQPIEYKPFRAKKDATDVVVRTIVMNQGKPINVDYRLEKTTAGWKVYDLNIGNIWLIQTYREQFDQKISDNGIDGLLRFLTERNQQLKPGRSTS